jgi:hypothetical protein
MGTDANIFHRYSTSGKVPFIARSCRALPIAILGGAVKASILKAFSGAAGQD